LNRLNRDMVWWLTRAFGVLALWLLLVDQWGVIAQSSLRGLGPT